MPVKLFVVIYLVLCKIVRIERGKDVSTEKIDFVVKSSTDAALILY